MFAFFSFHTKIKNPCFTDKVKYIPNRMNFTINDISEGLEHRPIPCEDTSVSGTFPFQFRVSDFQLLFILHSENSVY